MISIIICTKCEKQLDSLKENIAKSIGCPFELIIKEDAFGKYGLSKSYNEGADEAKYDILCFMHDDIKFESNCWGQKVIQILGDKNIGLLGVAGGIAKTKIPSDWWGYYSDAEINIIQHYKYNMQVNRHINQSFSGNKLADVVALDGVWLCSRKDVFSSYQFDEVNFNRFHGYDIDYSLQIFHSYRVCVTFDVLLHHFSDGNYSVEWVKAAFDVSEKWKEYLPQKINTFPSRKMNAMIRINLKAFIKILFKNGMAPKFIFDTIKKYTLQDYFKPGLFLLMCFTQIRYSYRYRYGKKMQLPISTGQ